MTVMGMPTQSGFFISKTPYAPEKQFIPEALEKWTFFRRAPEGSGEADLPPEALEKQTFLQSLQSLQRNRLSSGASGEHSPSHVFLSECSGGKPASPEPDLRAGLQ